jgi:hypothetical protein
MIINGTNIIQFGTGDINVSSGKLIVDEDVPFVSFTQGSNGEIGRDTLDEKDMGEDGRISDNGSHTRLIFTNEASIDVLINHLNACKKYINGTNI